LELGIARGAYQYEFDRIANGKAECDGNVLKGRVTEVIYLGQSRKYVLRMPCGAEVVVLEQARGADRTNAAAGDELTLTWSGREANALAEYAEGS
jgi:putative spermidine/putrescine transport system ATP-binding protein